MQALRDWSFARVLLASVGWIFLCLLMAAAWLLFQFRGLSGTSSGSGGIGAVSFGINVFGPAIPIAPPIVLVAAWLIARRR